MIVGGASRPELGADLSPGLARSVFRGERDLLLPPPRLKGKAGRCAEPEALEPGAGTVETLAGVGRSPPHRWLKRVASQF